MNGHSAVFGSKVRIFLVVTKLAAAAQGLQGGKGCIMICYWAQIPAILIRYCFKIKFVIFVIRPKNCL